MILCPKFLLFPCLFCSTAALAAVRSLLQIRARTDSIAGHVLGYERDELNNYANTIIISITHQGTVKLNYALCLSAVTVLTCWMKQNKEIYMCLNSLMEDRVHAIDLIYKVCITVFFILDLFYITQFPCNYKIQTTTAT